MADGTARSAVRQHLASRGWALRDSRVAEVWDLSPAPGSPVRLRAVLWPRTTRLAALADPREPSWTAQFGEDVPAAVITAALDAAEKEMRDRG